MLKLPSRDPLKTEGGTNCLRCPELDPPGALTIVLPCKREHDFHVLASAPKRLRNDHQMATVWEPLAPKSHQKAFPRGIEKRLENMVVFFSRLCADTAPKVTSKWANISQHVASQNHLWHRQGSGGTPGHQNYPKINRSITLIKASALNPLTFLDPEMGGEVY